MKYFQNILWEKTPRNVMKLQEEGEKGHWKV
jgi:hypothetical protein